MNKSLSRDVQAASRKRLCVSLDCSREDAVAMDPAVTDLATTETTANNCIREFVGCYLVCVWIVVCVTLLCVRCLCVCV